MKYILSLLGFNLSTVDRIDGGSKRQMIFAALIVWLVAGISAFLFATTISNLCFEGKYFWLIAIVWFVFMYALDGLILAANAKSSSVMYIRIGICFILACFHSLTLDTFAFSKDINNYLTREYNQELAVLDSTFNEDRLIPVMERRKAMKDRNQALADQEKSSRDRVYEEIHVGGGGRGPGYGPNAKAKQSIYQSDSTSFALEKERNQGEIAKIDDELNELKEVLQTRKDQLVKPESAGLRDNVNALHALVFGPNGTFMDKFYFILLMLMGAIFESLVLISKLAFKPAFLAYQDEQGQERVRVSNRASKRRQQEDQLEDMKDTLEYQKKASLVNREMELYVIQERHELTMAKAKEKLDHVSEEMDLIYARMKEVDARDKKAKKELKHIYEEVIKPKVIDVQLQKIQGIANELQSGKI